NILSRDVLPDVRNAYAIISSKESHKVRPQTYGNIARPSNVTRPSTSGNRRPTGGPHLVCEKCRFNGYTIGRCFKIIRFPRDFGKKNDSNNNAQNGYNFKKRFVNNNSVGSNSSSSSSSFSDEQISKLISLIKENSGNTVEKDVHANMAARLIVDYGANQHRTYSDKFLVNVIDISKFGIKVSHTNETEALITNVGNMVLTKDITLLGHPSDQVMNALKNDIVFEKINGENIAYLSAECENNDKFSSTSEKCVLVGYSSFKKGDPGVPYDDRNDNASSQCDGSNHPHHSSPTMDHNEDGLGHLHGSNGSASEDEVATTFEEYVTPLFLYIAAEANLGYYFKVASRGWSFASAVPGQITHLVVISTLDSANSCVIAGGSSVHQRVCFHVIFVNVIVGVIIVVVGGGVSSIFRWGRRSKLRKMVISITGLDSDVLITELRKKMENGIRLLRGGVIVLQEQRISGSNSSDGG
ncbi:hypothetical protein Tco_0501863, partial [Tanacetum coccineum]